MINKPVLSILTLILCVFIQLSLAQSDQKTLPQSVIYEMAKRETRYHHYLWHNIRENWNRLSSSAQKEIKDLGWAPPRAARRFVNGDSVAILDNNSGEDFLYMHRQMINRVNQILAANGESYGSRVTGWKTLPAPGDKDWPVPPAYTVPGNSGRTSTIKTWKSTSFYNNNIRLNEKLFTNPSELRKMTLGELGARLEVTVHGWMHLRFSDKPIDGFRPSTSAGISYIDEIWDDPSYNWLVDTYSSHVHPAFWKLHGWVDDRIEDWRKANGLSSIKWKGTWEGGPMSSLADLLHFKQAKPTSLRVKSAEKTEDMQDTMSEVAKILAKEGIETSFADPVLLEVPKKVARPSKRTCKGKSGRKNNKN